MYTPSRLLVSIVLLVLASGCTGISSSSPTSSFWRQTQKGVLSAYQSTKNSVSSIFKQLSADKGNKKEKEKPAKKNLSPSVDSYPARYQFNYEEEIKAGRLKSIKEPILRRSGSKGFHIVPRNSQSLDELHKRITAIDRELVLERDPKRRDTLLRRRNRLAETRERTFKENKMIIEVEKTRKKLQLQEKEFRDFKKKGGDFR